MPTKKTIINFQNHFKKLPIPFTIYADFECFTMPISTCKPNPDSYKQKSRQKKSFTLSYQKHEPSGYCLYIKALDGMEANFKPLVYKKKTSDEDISKRFIKHVVKLTHKIYQDYYKNPKTMIFKSKDQKYFQSATHCHNCVKKLFRDKETNKILKAREHCHFTGEHRGAADNECNLKCKKPLILPVIFHNLQGYDSHLFIKQLAKVSEELTCQSFLQEQKGSLVPSRRNILF